MKGKKSVGLHNQTCSHPESFPEEVAVDTGPFIIEMAGGFLEPVTNIQRDDRRSDQLGMGMFERGSRGPAMIFEDDDHFEARVLPQGEYLPGKPAESLLPVSLPSKRGTGYAGGIR